MTVDSPHTSRPPLTPHEPTRSGLAATLSDSAVLAGLYVTGAAVFVTQISGLAERTPPKFLLGALGVTFCTTVAVYLLDRVKLRNVWLDPADADAHPRRHAFIVRHAARLRAMSAALLLFAAVLGAWLLPLGWFLPVLAAIGVLTYAGRPRGDRARPKDVLLLKNAYVAAGITGFAAIIAIGAAHPDRTLDSFTHVVQDHFAPLAITCALLMVRVLADAILCDLDDETADRRFNTRTLPVRLGRARAWNAAMGLRLFTAGLLAIAPVLPAVPRLTWCVVTVLSSLVLRFVAPTRVRDWVDSRFFVESCVVWIVVLIAAR